MKRFFFVSLYMLIDEQGGLIKIHFTLDNQNAIVIGSTKAGRKISDTIDEIRICSEYKLYTRGQLYLMQKEGRIQ